MLALRPTGKGCSDWKEVPPKNEHDPNTLDWVEETEMARHKQDKIAAPEAVKAADVQAEQFIAEQGEIELSRDSVNQMIGQIQMANAFSDFADVVSLTKLDYIKKNKLYQSLKGQSVMSVNGDKIADVGTWEGFLNVFGLKRSLVDEKLLNLRVFGEQALENLNRIGAGYKDLRQFRKLPEDDLQALVKEVEDAGDDPKRIAAIIEEISSTAQQKLSAAEAKAESTQAELDKVQADAAKERDVADKMLADKQRQADDLDKELRRLASASVDEWAEGLNAQITKLKDRLLVVDSVGDTKVVGAFTEFRYLASQIQQRKDAPRYLHNELSNLLTLLITELQQLQDEYGLTADITVEPIKDDISEWAGDSLLSTAQ
jgi:hypothetical protein